MANEITPQQLFSEYGVLNDLRPADGLTGDRRSLTTTDALSAVLEQAYTPDAIGSKTRFGGIVMATVLSDQPVASVNPIENLEYVSRQLELANDPSLTNEALYFTYKVYIHETDPRVVIDIDELLKEDARKLNLQGLSLAERISTLPDATLALDANIPNSQIAIEPGTLVEVIYLNEERYLNPQIVNVGSKIFDINFDNSSIKLKHQAGTPTTLGAPTPGQEKAINLKDLRRQIFESKGNETIKALSGYTFSSSDARGGLDGPLNKKSGLSWERNAILDIPEQRQLKNKFMPEIEAMLNRLGMPLTTFERILRKESGIFDPYAINNNTAATGLIQFMPKTAKGLGTTVEKLLTMGPKEQLTYVEKYFSNLKGSRTISSNNQGVDWYFLVFYPAAIGKDDNYEIGGNNKKLAASQNPAYRDPLHPQNFITRRSVISAWKKS
jgi:hypothetical protein